MKIIFVARNIPLPSYRENDVVLQLAERLRTQGIIVSVLFPSEWLPLPNNWLTGVHKAISKLGRTFEVCRFDVEVLKYVRLPTLSLSYLLCGFYWPRKKFDQIDFVHAHYVLPDGWMGLRLARDHACPLAVTVRQGDLRKMGEMADWVPVKRMYHQVLAQADVVFSPSMTVVNALETQGYAAQLMPHGVDDTELLESFPPSRQVITVVVACALIPSKRVDWVIRTLGAYSGEKQVALVVLGDGECLLELRELAQELAVDAVFMGHVERDVVFDQMQQADVFALPSISETFGLAYLEAALRACAVVAIEGTGVAGCFKHRDEMIFSESNFASFSRELRQLIDDDLGRVQLAKNARSRARKDYLWSDVVNRYLAAMAKVSC